MTNDKRKGNEKRWYKLGISLNNYKNYISRKTTTNLTLIDLLYISNFKGGNAAIHEEEYALNVRLQT